VRTAAGQLLIKYWLNASKLALVKRWSNTGQKRRGEDHADRGAEGDEIEDEEGADEQEDEDQMPLEVLEGHRAPHLRGKPAGDFDQAGIRLSFASPARSTAMLPSEFDQY
jgi:hypothetical protein